MLTKKEQKEFESMFQEILGRKHMAKKRKLDLFADLLFELTGNVNLQMWFSGLEIKT